MILAFKIFVNVLIVGLFLYSKLLPHQDKLNKPYKSAFNFFQSIFQPVLSLLKSLIKPFQVGQGLAVDMTQIALLILLLLLNNYL
ncbi:YggT family protein [Pedobacter fastidiosus]|uniref:YggT family protein n=1 Tax=Pedobacter fastidiosus TaxID=2765361 RepID=A0ABR7KP96_9SPHI|nr:YggT family protein [Pedobacter fastidiosus]